MWRIPSVYILVVTTCVLCPSAEALEVCNDGALSTIQYFMTSWQHVIGGINFERIELSASSIAALPFSGTEHVAIVVHGRQSGVWTHFGETLQYSLIQADQQMIVFFIDWSILSWMPSYEDTLAFVPCVAQDLSDFIDLMVAARKLDVNRLHLIGFDLGAHIVGIAGRKSAARVRKITGLDPAGAQWDAASQRLRATDAQFVEVIHTNGNRTLGTTYGIGEPIGALDFFVNGGARQPGCGFFDNECHHRRAWQVFAGTVDTGGHLLGLRCENMTQVNSNRCNQGPVAQLGTLNMIKLGVGIYRVNTGSIYPF